jgi:hypothetical protein
MDHHHRALALEEVAQRLLAIESGVADQVEHIILDLEGDSDQAEGLIEAVEPLGRRLAGANRAQPAGRDAGVPARLLRAHPAVVCVAHGHEVPADPAKLDRLALHGFAAHVEDFVDETERAREAQLGKV